MIKQVAKKISAAMPSLLNFKKGNRFIFVYHDISETSDFRHSAYYSTTPENFKRHLDFFQKHFELISLESLIAGNSFSEKKNFASIVFDDGFKSVLTEALPVLKNKSIPFAVFINKCAVELQHLWITDIEMNEARFRNLLDENGFEIKTGNKNALIEALKCDKKFNNNIPVFYSDERTEKIFLSSDDIRKLDGENVLIGSHSANHPVMALCSDTRAEEEIKSNKNFIEAILNKTVEHFAIPFGKKEHYSPAVIDAILKAGHKYIYTTNVTGFKLNKEHRNIFPRIGLTNESISGLNFYINRALLKNIET